MSVVANRRLSPVEQYEKSVTAPETALDWVLALSDPLSLIGQDFFALLMRHSAEKDAIDRFEECLAYATFTKQQRVQEQIRRELEYQADLERSRMLDAWASSQIKSIPEEDRPVETQGLLDDIFRLLLEAGQLTAVLSAFAVQQKNLHAKWHDDHEAKANRTIQNMIVSGELANLTEVKKQALIQALIPATPALMAKLIPGLAKKVREMEQVNTLNPIAIRMAEMNQLLGQLRFHAQLGGDPENGPLMGAELLAALRNSKKTNAHFNLSDEERVAFAKQIQQDMLLFNRMRTTTDQLDKTEMRLKQQVEALKQRVDGLKPPMTGGQRSQEELEEELKKAIEHEERRRRMRRR